MQSAYTDLVHLFISLKEAADTIRIRITGNINVIHDAGGYFLTETVKILFLSIEKRTYADRMATRESLRNNFTIFF